MVEYKSSPVIVPAGEGGVSCVQVGRLESSSSAAAAATKDQKQSAQQETTLSVAHKLARYHTHSCNRWW